nr:GMC family oxidoreductase N-terminal domain-containing protein [Acidobacteriota bacterium]
MTPKHFDAVVVGSGFGGSAAAHRLAEAGLSVCLLERGKVYPPGSFPRSPAGMRDNFWDPSEGLQGLFNVWSFQGLEALVASGLGGGSLIYANVLLRKDERWFAREDGDGAREYWPVTRSELDPHYDRVEKMLAPQRFPFELDPYSKTPKTRAFQYAAQRLGREWGLPPLAVTFANAGEPPTPGVPIREESPNLHGHGRTTCVLCGECDIGCNYGSKNTLDYNFLTAAARLGADLRARCEVKRISPRPGGGYSVDYVEHTPDNQGRKTETSCLPAVTVTATRLVLSAGALGSTYLLLNNRPNFPALSAALGTRFCGNGDLLGVFLRSRNADTGGARLLDPGRGPVITSYVRVPDALDGGGATGRGHYVEDGGHPEFVNWLVEASQVPGLARRMARFLRRRLEGFLAREPRSDWSAEVRSLLGSCEMSSSSLPVLGMGRDVPDGTMRLRRGFLDVDWTTRSSQSYFDGMRATMKEMAKVLGARFRDNPIWYLRRVITVHPLGGCPMGRGPEEG